MLPSVTNPLVRPHDSELLRGFSEHFGLPGSAEPGEMLRGMTAAFARLPYENLTKIIKEDEHGGGEFARRPPAEVLADHARLGTGGTCFSLTATLLHLVRSLGFQAEPILADRRYGADTHCALLVWIDGQPHLIDPGYMIVEPIPLDGGARRQVVTGFNELLLAPHPRGDKLDLATVDAGAAATYRLTYKTTPADAGEFLKAWDESFDWDMMQYPLVSRACGGQQLYLRGRHFQVRSRAAVERQDILPDELVGRIAGEFGIDPQVARRALDVLKRKGRCYG
jgi:arylamine N-acetyltransferase